MYKRQCHKDVHDKAEQGVQLAGGNVTVQHIFCAEPAQRDVAAVHCHQPVSYTHLDVYKRQPEDAADVLDELIDRYGDPPPSVSDLVNVSLVRVQAAAVGVYERCV